MSRFDGYTVRCLSEAMSPITHMSGSSGNESIVAREAVTTSRGKMMVPYLSGNAIRHRCVREPGMRWLVREYGLAGTMSLQSLNFLFSGGSLTEGGGREDTARVADMQRLWPLLRLLGGCVPDQILAGSLHAWRGSLVCEENRGSLGCDLDFREDVARLRPAESFVTGYQYVRNNAGKAHVQLLKPVAGGDAPEDSGQMIFAGQAVTRGAMFSHGFVVDGGVLELGALLWSLRLWQAAGGTVGGQASRGHGRLSTHLVGVDVAEADAACEAYTTHAGASRDEAVAWLETHLAPRAAKAAAKGKGKGKDKAGSEEAA